MLIIQLNSPAITEHTPHTLHTVSHYLTLSHSHTYIQVLRGTLNNLSVICCTRLPAPDGIILNRLAPPTLSLIKERRGQTALTTLSLGWERKEQEYITAQYNTVQCSTVQYSAGQ